MKEIMKEDAYLKLNPTQQLCEALKYEKSIITGKINVLSLPKIKLAVLSSYSIQHLVKVLNYMLYLNGFQSEIYEGNYNSINAEILDSQSGLYAFKPDVIIILPHYSDIKNMPDFFSNHSTIDEKLNEYVAYYHRLWSQLQSLNGVHIIQSNLVLPNYRVLGSMEANVLYSQNTFLQMLNLKLMEGKPWNITFVDFEFLASSVGKNNWFDMSGYFLNKVGFNLKYLGYAAKYLVHIICALKGKAKKCLVLDLDNTLWGGIVSEDGSQNIQLDPTHPVGEAFLAFQSYILSLKNRGVILAICSKNDFEIAKQPFLDNPYMQISLDDISSFIANWDDKATNLKRIAEEINIGLDSLIFFDDNIAEREIVSKYLPEVTVIDVPDDPALYITALDQAAPFDWIQMTQEDVIRNKTYMDNKKRNFLKESFVNYEEYLEALNMQAEMKQVTDYELLRFTQLINKTNQFNLTTIRYTESSLSNFQKDRNYQLFYVTLRDKFSNYGIISCIILKYLISDGKKVCVIDTWVTSCRVLKRKLEEFIMNKIVQAAMDVGCSILLSEYRETAKNHMVCNLYESLGMELNCDEGGIKKYSCNLNTWEGFKNLAIKEINNDL